MTIHVVLPAHLRTLARVSGGIEVEVESPVTVGAILDSIEAGYPMLKGTIRDHASRKRRPFVRYFACGRDISFQADDQSLPDAIAAGEQPFMIVGAIAGG